MKKLPKTYLNLLKFYIFVIIKDTKSFQNFFKKKFQTWRDKLFKTLEMYIELTSN